MLGICKKTTMHTMQIEETCNLCIFWFSEHLTDLNSRMKLILLFVKFAPIYHTFYIDSRLNMNNP